MTDTAQPIIGASSHPPWNIPTIFVDNVISIFRGGGIVKYYFVRFDPDMSALASPNPVPVCQVVMPIGGFAAMTLFFQQQLELMIQRNEISPEVINQLRETIAAQATQAVQTPQPQQGQSNAG